MADTMVLITGASGYLGLHCVEQSLEAGFRVRATVRDLATKAQPLRDLFPEAKDRLEVVEADLLDADSWTRAVEGVTIIFHLASPTPSGVVTDEETVIKPAIEGTLNVLKAAAKGKVKRVVFTSSASAITVGGSHPSGKVFSEADWREEPPPNCQTYNKSKILAEKAALDFLAQLPEAERVEWVTLYPGLIVGPLLATANCTSVDVMKRFLEADLPLVPGMMMEYVDVRDVAKAHVLAATRAADGERVILSSYVGWCKDMCQILKDEFGQYGYAPVTKEAPKILMKVISWFDPMIRLIYPQLGFQFTVDTAKMSTVLGTCPTVTGHRRAAQRSLEPIAIEKSLRDMGHSMIQRGLVVKKPDYTPPEPISA